jgi:hypothetical protein
MKKAKKMAGRAKADRGHIPLTSGQKEILIEFYGVAPTQVLFTKIERNSIWSEFKKKRKLPSSLNIKQKCPALSDEIEKSLQSGKLIQSAIFSECVYAQTLANMLGLKNFFNFTFNPECLEDDIISLIASYRLKPRYVYKSSDQSRVLIQAGGFDGVDSALITVQEKKVFTIEFKEPAAKTSEFDLPRYREDGYLILDEEFSVERPHFESMVEEQIKKKLNFWDAMGSNVNDFDPLNVLFAVSENYNHKKYADVICVEDVDGFLTMIPANQVSLWASTKGEIRPGGRNPYSVWTPVTLKRFIIDLGGNIKDGVVTVPLKNLTTAKRRGGNDDIGRFKINPIFFVKPDKVRKSGDQINFELKDVRQNKPTISAHMFFDDLAIEEVHNHYKVEF